MVLWWYFNLPAEKLGDFKEKFPDIKQIFFNWDEPFNWEPCDIENKAKYGLSKRLPALSCS